MLHTTHKPVRITLSSDRYEIAGSLFDTVYGHMTGVQTVSPEEELQMGVLPDPDEDGGERYFVKPADPAVLRAKQDTENGKPNDSIEKIDLFTEGVLSIIPDTTSEEEAATVSISYEESELTGMEGSTSTVTYRTDDRGLVTMLRSGAVQTAMTFRAHTRSICTYETPYMPFEVGVHALIVDNRLDTDGELRLDYIIEIRGGCAERCSMLMKIIADEN